MAVERPRESRIQRDPSEEIEWLEFREMISHFSFQDMYDTEHAYLVAQAAHRGQIRESGERYFSHPRAVALILLNIGVRDPELNQVALLHDVPEDKPEHLESAQSQDTEYFESLIFTRSPFVDPFGFSTEVNFPEYQLGPEEEKYWMDEYERSLNEFAFQTKLRRSFSVRVSLMVGQLKKPDGLTKEVIAKEYHEQLRGASPGALLVKMADTLHNLWTMDGVSAEKRERKVAEYETHYFPIFQRAIRAYPVEGGKLYAMLTAAVASLKR